MKRYPTLVIYTLFFLIVICVISWHQIHFVQIAEGSLLINQNNISTVGGNTTSSLIESLRNDLQYVREASANGNNTELLDYLNNAETHLSQLQGNLTHIGESIMKCLESDCGGPIDPPTEKCPPFCRPPR